MADRDSLYALAVNAAGGAGYSTRSDNGRRERLWCSPACLGEMRQDSLLEGLTA